MHQNTNINPAQLFLGTLDKIYIVDKVENNPTQINGHPAWAAGEFDLLLCCPGCVAY